jgi:tetratricopeptide (TPR) repeat protein
MEAALGGPWPLCDATPESRRATPAIRERGLLGSGYPLFENSLLEALKAESPDDEFLRAWYVTVMAYADRAFPGDHTCFENAPSRIRAHPEMQLALGAMHEKTWRQVEADGMSFPPFRPSLQEAERAFPRALQAAPDLHEARLRLGHVLVLQSRPNDALQELRLVRDHLDGGLAYVLRLVEGQAYEQRGDVDRARDSYQAARAMFPRAQSAIMALAQLAYLQGHRAEALEHIQQLPGAATAGGRLQPWVWYAEGADPWSWYYFGTAWRFPTYLARLRNLVRETR